MVNNTKDSTISKADAKKRLNTLNIIKNSEIKHKRLIPGQKELSNSFDDLSDIILTDKTLMLLKDEKLKEEKKDEKLKEEKGNEKLKEEKGNKNKNEDENENGNENENENEDEDEDDDIIKILTHSNESDKETINQNKKIK